MTFLAESELPAYDALVAQSPQASIYCRRWWLDAVAPGRLAVLAARRDGACAAAWPLVADAPGSLRFTMPRLTQKLGILFADSAAKPAERLSREHALVAELVAALPEGAVVYQHFHERFRNFLPFHWQGWRQATRCTYVLDGVDDRDAAWDGLRAGCRTAIRKAERQGLAVRDDLELDRFLALHRAVYARQGLACPLDDDLLRRVDAAARAHGAARLLAATDAAGRVHAAAYLAIDGDTAYYLLSGADPELRRSDALRLVLWEAIRTMPAGVRRLDFEGSMMPGPEALCRDFGATQVPYFAIHHPYFAAPTLGAIARSTASALRHWADVRLRSRTA